MRCLFRTSSATIKSFVQTGVHHRWDSTQDPFFKNFCTRKWPHRAEKVDITSHAKNQNQEPMQSSERHFQFYQSSLLMAQDTLNIAKISGYLTSSTSALCNYSRGTQEIHSFRWDTHRFSGYIHDLPKHISTIKGNAFTCWKFFFNCLQ